MPDDDDPIAKSDRPTDEIDPRDMKVSWPMAIASLEQLGDWQVFALRLGTLTLIQHCVRDMAERTATAAYVPWMRELVEALARMPWQHDDDSGRVVVPVGRMRV